MSKVTVALTFDILTYKTIGVHSSSWPLTVPILKVYFYAPEGGHHVFELSVRQSVCQSVTKTLTLLITFLLVNGFTSFLDTTFLGTRAFNCQVVWWPWPQNDLDLQGQIFKKALLRGHCHLTVTFLFWIFFYNFYNLNNPVINFSWRHEIIFYFYCVFSWLISVLYKII